MRKLFLLSLTLLSLSILNAQDGHNHSTQPTPSGGAEVINFKQLEYDFGKIPQGKPVYYSFEIVNTAKTPSRLNNVLATCGCTTPEWNKEEIAPGATSAIKVGYNAAAEGPFEKIITVTYNENVTKQIKIKGHVWKAPIGAAPANSSVQFLKQQIQ